MMKVYEFIEDVSDEDRIKRMESYLDEMIRLTNELPDRVNNVNPATRSENINTL